MRTLIFHFHLFKNAGTSVDAMLEANFGARWTSAEFPFEPHGANREAVRRFLMDRPELKAFSSHTARLPVPQIEGLAILPVLFLRHPVLRARSAYRFERRQAAALPDAELTVGAKLARDHDFAGYVRALLAPGGGRQLRDFQAHRLADAIDAEGASLRQRAEQALAALPFVGCVEHFEASVARFATLARPAFPDFEPVISRKNASGDTAFETQAGLDALCAELGAALYDELVAANRIDLALHARVAERYASSAPS